jgi:hypothetical protein
MGNKKPRYGVLLFDQDWKSIMGRKFDIVIVVSDAADETYKISDYLCV